MALKTEILAFHGWGFDQNAWSLWQEYLSPSCSLKTFDRGYYGQPYDPEFTHRNTKKIVFAHSYGLHLCPTWQLEACDLLVIFSTFIHFHPEAPRLQRQSHLILRRMQERFAVEPREVLDEFIWRCYYPITYGKPISNIFDTARLAEDLSRLDHSRVCATTLEKAPRIQILHGTQDRIIPIEQGRALSERLKERAQYHEIEGAGHGLPFSHTRQCWDILEPVFREL